MAEAVAVPGVLELLIGASQGPPPAGVAYIYCITPDGLFLRTLADGIRPIGPGPCVVSAKTGVAMNADGTFVRIFRTGG